MPDLDTALTFFLVFVRFSGLVVSAPILGSSNFPVLGKIGLAGFSALLMTPIVALAGQSVPTDPVAFALMGAGELLIGLAMGLVMTLVFAAIQLGGQIMDMQSGFGLVNVFNPALETQFPIFGFFLFILAALYLFTIDGHHMMIVALADSFDRVPLGGLAPDADLMWVVTNWGAGVFYDALLISAPIAGAMMLAYVTMGIMGRVVPQLHLFVVGFPLTIALGLIVTALSIGLYLTLMDGVFQDMFEHVDELIDGLA